MRRKVPQCGATLDSIRSGYVELVCCLVYISERSSALQGLVKALQNELLVLCQPNAQATFVGILAHCCALLDTTKTKLDAFHAVLSRFKTTAESQRRCRDFSRSFDSHTPRRQNEVTAQIVDFRNKAAEIEGALSSYSHEVMGAAKGAFERLDAQIGHIESWSQLEGLLVQTPSFATRSIAPSGHDSALITATRFSPAVNQKQITWEDAARTHQGNAHTTRSRRSSSEDTYVIASRNNTAPSRYATKKTVSDITSSLWGKRAAPVDKTSDPREVADDVTKEWAESTTVRPYAS
jgi:hypothetical protein